MGNNKKLNQLLREISNSGPRPINDEFSRYGDDAWMSRHARHRLGHFDKMGPYKDPAKEAAFVNELKSTQMYKQLMDKGETLESMLNGDYDYRRALKEGVHREISPHDNMMHWSSKSKSGNWLKSPDHSTAWKEFYMAHHGVDPDDIGYKPDWAK